jgi:hypothetical protein
VTEHLVREARRPGAASAIPGVNILGLIAGGDHNGSFAAFYGTGGAVSYFLSAEEGLLPARSQLPARCELQ